MSDFTGTQILEVIGTYRIVAAEGEQAVAENYGDTVEPVRLCEPTSFEEARQVVIDLLRTYSGDRP